MQAPTHIINALNAKQWDEFKALVEAGYITPTGELTEKGRKQLGSLDSDHLTR